jgi:hypothetical protein
MLGEDLLDLVGCGLLALDLLDRFCLCVGNGAVFFG